MSRWLISVPAWGDRCVEVACAAALPALERAVVRLRAREGGFVDPRVVVHTDRPDRVRAAATRIAIEPRPVPAGLRDFDCLSQAHREVISMACGGDVVVFLTADLVISEQGLVYCDEALAGPQKRLVACAGVRALQEGRLPDTGDAAGLMRWAWDNRHPMTEACRWPGGDSADLSRMYFADEGSVVAYLALPHPLAVRVDGRTLRFSPTVDANLIQCFGPVEIHVARTSDRLALVELSPRDKDFQRAPRTMELRLAEDRIKVPDPLQRWCLAQRVSLVGPPRDCGDAAAIGGILGSGAAEQGG